ncbi:2Fe-2S iron-sulfur cluster-binding protein [Phyllobacterium sophorae]|uniref:2Fe-2S ferredoxin n=1 Tax=Phyllobacterium sophorae TaxID=1520277 RepID=A0A2P7B2Y3_9HYPH|nr:2Fe-2S iron-sulfur cluster-binding protein [Phyllobacterium sophorae]PSH60808.1 2Fe-2S ferredoxin [Phyllobacterium sophorae]
MPKISIIAKDGTPFELQVEAGSTVMENAVRNSIPGIVSECGGACACATCHVYVDEEWIERVGPPGSIEADMLEFAYDVRSTSRLSCQIKVSEEHEGLTMHVPERQS